MSEPTQAQIEAEELLAVKIHNASLPALTLNEARVIAQSAMDTAVAQVGKRYDIAHIARTAAVITKAKQDTIERCAQVLIELQDSYRRDFAAIAALSAGIAAIRKLKAVAHEH